MDDIKNEKISIDGYALQLGILFDGGKYRVYFYPGMTVEEVAFDIMVLTRLLIAEKHVKNKKEFDTLVKKYFNDPQYKPLEELKVSPSVYVEEADDA